MSDRDLRQMLNEIIADIDAGRLRPVRARMPTVRNVVGSAVLAAALGLGGAACDQRPVGTATDAGVRDAGAQVDSGGDMLYMAPFYDAGAQPEYAEPFEDAGLMPAYGEPFLDDGGVYEYMAPPVDAGDAPAYMAPSVDASVDPEPDGGPQTAYGVPPCPPMDEPEDD